MSFFKTLYYYALYAGLRFALFLRYKVTIKGMNQLVRELGDEKGGLIFLANHPALIDPPILTAVLWPRFQPHPLAIEYLFYKPFVRYLLKILGTLPIPNFDESANSYKKKRIDATYEALFSLLREKKNLLIYPAGQLKSQAEEKIGGASGVHRILSSVPEARVVLVRTTGLWGSRFSRAFTGKTPEIISVFVEGVKDILKNGIFFAPRRKVVVELELAPKDFPYQATRRDLNRYLENWFNRPTPEPLKLVPYVFWKREVPSVPELTKRIKKINGEIPAEVEQKVKEEIALLTNLPVSSLSKEQDLSHDLGLDSLDIAQIVIMLKERFGVTAVHSSDLHSVESVMGFAAGLLKGEKQDEEILPPLTKEWETEKERPLAFAPVGETIPESFLHVSEKMRDYIACADALMGEVTYSRLRMAVIVLANHVMTYPDPRIGILLPASVAVNILILAIQMAGKVPVMINWTTGPRNLNAILKEAEVTKTISSWNFLDRLENVDLNGLDEQMLLLEDLRLQIPFRQKAKGYMLARQSSEKVIKHFGLQRLKGSDTAVVLFTSGTESFPKGVPLSHHNILSNQKDAFQLIDVQKKDVMLGSLPPFHSFGFSVTGLLPLLGGLRVVYSPNPTDGRRLTVCIQRWKVTIICLAPTFIKTLLRVAEPEQLSSLRLIVSGAEKMSKEMNEKIHELIPQGQLIEGYGITECSPILTVNPLYRPLKGVGLPLLHVKLLIVHPETFELVPTGTTGLILARGPNIFKGYLNSKIESPFVEVGGKKWYVTGDLGFLDEEGNLTLAGRLKRFIKIGGEMVSLNALEEILMQKGPELGWPLHPDQPSLAVTAQELEGKKGELHLFTTFPLTVDQANGILRASGMGNLIRFSGVKQLPLIPLLGSGKIDYQALNKHIN